jgi:hypothetical protein
LVFVLITLDRARDLSKSLVQAYVGVHVAFVFDLPEASYLQLPFAYTLGVYAAEMRTVISLQALVGDEFVAVHAWPPVDEGVVLVEFSDGVSTVD